MDLKEGIYDIPEGYRAIVSHGKVEIKRKVIKSARDPRRCGNCKFQIQGFCRASSNYPTAVCAKRPKGENLYYRAFSDRFACEMFEMK